MINEIFTIILTSYKRPRNINRLINIFKGISYPHQILVLNVNPDIKMEDYIDKTSLPLIEITNYSDRKYMLLRYGVAYESDGKNFLVIDDDLFYSTRQIEQLIGYYLEEPEYIHGGGFGQEIQTKKGVTTLARCNPWCDGSVDVIGRIYCFGRSHIDDFKSLLDRLEIDFNHPAPVCDILLSWSGRPGKKPVCHDLGYYNNCPTSGTPGIAVYKTRPGFHAQRNELVKRLLKHFQAG